MLVSKRNILLKNFKTKYSMFNANKMYPSQIMYGSILFFKLWSILNNWDFIQMYMNIYVCLILFLIEIGYIINTPTLLPTRFTIYFCCFYFCAFHPATTTTTTTTTTTALPCVDNQPAFCSAPGVDVVICSNLDRAVKYCQKTCNKCGM